MRELSMHILDMLENALEAGATEVELTVDEDRQADRLTMVVRDNGRGMGAEACRRALDPFFTTRTTRHVGLGLPLLAAAARRCAGDLVLESTPGQGTAVTATFRHSHLDRAPLGNMTDTLVAFLLGSTATQRPGSGTPAVETNLRYRHRVDDRSFDFDTAAIRAELGGIPLSYPPVRNWLREFIADGESSLA